MDGRLAVEMIRDTIAVETIRDIIGRQDLRDGSEKLKLVADVIKTVKRPKETRPNYR